MRGVRQLELWRFDCFLQRAIRTVFAREDACDRLAFGVVVIEVLCRDDSLLVDKRVARCL